MEKRREKNLRRERRELCRRYFAFLLVFAVMFTSIPIQNVWASDTFYERLEDDEIILDDSIEEGDMEELDVDISHIISHKGDKATVTVSAAPSETGKENGVKKVTKVEIHENGRTKKGTRVDGDWQFTVKENGTYSFIIYYSSADGEKIMEASPSDAEKTEKETSEIPDTIPAEDEIISEPETEPAGEESESETSESDENAGDSTEGDSEKDTPVSDVEIADDINQSDGGDATEENTDKENETGSSQAEEDAGHGSDGDAESSEDGSSNASDSVDSIALNIVDFFFPVIEAYAGNFTVKKAVIIEYEISNLFPEGDPEDVDMDILEEITEQGAMITISAEPSDIGLEKGVVEITDVSLIDFKAKENAENVIEETEESIATDSELEEIFDEEDLINDLEETEQASPSDAEYASPSDAENDTAKSLSAKHAEYQKSEIDGDEHHFFVKANGTYTFSIRYGTAADPDFEDSTELVETQFPITYELESVGENKIIFLGVEDTQINQGAKFDLLEGVLAVDAEGIEVAPVEVLDDGGFDSKKPGDYFVTYTTLTENPGMMMTLDGDNLTSAPAPSTAVRMISVKAVEGNLELTSKTGIFKKEMATLPNYAGQDTLRVTYTPNPEAKGRYLELTYPANIFLNAFPDTNETIIDVIRSQGCTRFYIADDAEGQIRFELLVGYSGGRDTKDYDTWTYTDKEVTTGGPITIEEVYGENIKGGISQLAEMIFKKPVGAKDLFDSRDDSLINNIKLDRSGQNKAGGMTNGTFRLMNESPKLTAVDYVRIYGQSESSGQGTDISVGSYGSYESVVSSTEEGTEGNRSYIQYKIEPYARRYNICIRLPNTVEINTGDSYLTSESTLSNVLNADVEVGYTSGGEKKIFSYEYRPTVTVEKWKEVDYDIQYRDVIGQSHDDGDENSKYICIGKNVYPLSPTSVSLRRINVPGMEIAKETDSPVDSMCTYYLKETYTTEAVLTMELPYELDVDFKDESGMTYDLPAAGIKTVSMTFTDGSKQTFKVEDGEEQFPWRKFKKPEGAKVKKLELIYNGPIEERTWLSTGFPSFDFIQQTPYLCGTTHIDGTLIKDGDVLKPIIFDVRFKETDSGKKFKDFHQELELIAKDALKREISIEAREDKKVENSLSYDGEEWLNGQTFQFYIKAYLDVNNSAYDIKELVNPAITIKAHSSTGEMNLAFLTGEMTCNSFLNGWSITYATRDKGEQEYHISDIEEWQEIKLLSDGDQFESQDIVFSKDGEVIPIEGDWIKDIKVKVRPFNKEDIYLYGDIKEVDNNTGGIFQVSYPVSLVSNGVKTTEALPGFRCYTHAMMVTTAVRPYILNPPSLAYQGSTITQHLIVLDNSKGYANKWASTNPEGSFVSVELRRPKEFIYYIKIDDTDTFHMVKDSISTSSSAIIEKIFLDGELWYKIISSDKEAIGIDLYTDPAATTGTVPDNQKPKVEIYCDVSEYLEENGLDKNRIEVRVKDLVSCPLEPEKGKAFVHVTDTLGAPEIMLRSVAGVQLSLGANGNYSSPKASFQDCEKDSLGALLSLGTKTSDIYNIEILVNIPKKGDTVQYSDASETKEVSSQYDIFLTDKVTPSNVPAGSSISYYYEENGEWKVNPDSWENVTRIKIEMSKLDVEKAATFKIPLSAGAKDVNGDLNGYMSTAWNFTNAPDENIGSDYICGSLRTYIYRDNTISGSVWNDSDEDGKLESPDENKIAGVKIQLYHEGSESPIAETTTTTEGEYTFGTRFSEGLKLKITPPDNMLLTKYKTGEGAAALTSKFVRDKEDGNYLYAELPDLLVGDVPAMNAGFITPPTISMDNVRVKLRQTVNAKATAISAAPDKLKVYYTQAEDPSVASLNIGSDGTAITDADGNISIQGNKLSEITTATAWAENSLGDKVSTTYQIAVSNDDPPAFTEIHPWVAIEGDTIPDLWDGIEAEDPEEKYPAWKIMLYGAVGKNLRSIDDSRKTVAIYTPLDNEIALEDALASAGNYRVKYTIVDDMGNEVTAGTTLTVYGKMQGENVEKHYFATGETIPIPAAKFYYLDPAGTAISATDDMLYKDSSVTQWKLDDGALPQSDQEVTHHPMENSVTEGVEAGSGRTAAAQAKGAVDSRVTITNTRPSYVAILNEEVKVGWETETDATYNHWTVDGNMTTEKADREIKKADGTVIPDNFKQDTSAPVLVTYEKHGVSPETYDNRNALGETIENKTTVEETIRVIGKPVIEAETVIYVTPEQAKSEAEVRGKLKESASYHDGENAKAAVPDENITVRYTRKGDVITSVEIQAWAGREDNLSDVHTVTVVVRFDVTFTTNNDDRHEKGTIGGGTADIKYPTIYGTTAKLPVVAANEGYHFDGYRTLNEMKASAEISLPDGRVIPAGSTIPVGTLLSETQVAGIQIYDAVGFEAYFSSTPVIEGQNIMLYVGEKYEQSALSIDVSDLDGNANSVNIADENVDTGKAGTYQVKVSVTDKDGNYAEKYVYVQVFGKTIFEGNEPVHVRQNSHPKEDELKGSMKAVYDAPPEIPVTPWEEDMQPAVKTELEYCSGAPTPDTSRIGIIKARPNAAGQIPGRGVDGMVELEKNVYVDGYPTITANDGALFTHESTDQDSLIALIKQNAQACITYGVDDGTDYGTTKTVTVPGTDLQYEIEAEENYVPRTEGTYKVTIRFNEADYAPAGLKPVDVQLPAVVVVSDKTYDIKFNTNYDATYHRGEFEGGELEFNTKAIHGMPVARMPVPVAADGYHFDGFKTQTAFTTTDDLTLADGTIISAGDTIPAGTLLTTEQVSTMKLYGDMEFQAYFSATPVIKGSNIVLYEKEEYKQEKLYIEVTDADQNISSRLIDDAHVDTSVPGTYQVKVMVSDTDGNTAENCFYVQVVGKSYFTAIQDIHTRQKEMLTSEQLLEGVTAVYKKPLDIPEEPWADTNKSNNNQPAILTAVEVSTFDTVDATSIRKTKIDFTAPGMIHGREMIGRATGERNIYIHGNPVVVAYDNGLFTHQSTGADALEQAVRTGQGTMVREAASAYVEYVQPDGTVKKIVIAPEKISYEAGQYVPLTAGDYTVKATVDDSSVLEQAQADKLGAVIAEKAVKVIVADKLYTVMFEMGEHGGFENPADSITTVAHGKNAVSPSLAPEEGYEIDYWVDETGNRVNLSSVIITKDRKFTAEFKIKVFTVRFIGKKDRVIKTELVKYGHDAIPPTEDKDVKNKRFDGWSKSYQNIKEDTDIYTTYWKSSGGGPSGGGGSVPTGPGITAPGNETPTDKPELTAPTSNVTPVGYVPTPIKMIPVVSIEELALLPKTGDTTSGKKSWLSFDVREIEEDNLINDSVINGTTSQPGILSSETAANKFKKCILHIILLGAAILEGIYYLFKKRRDKKELQELIEELNGPDEKEDK